MENASREKGVKFSVKYQIFSYRCSLPIFLEMWGGGIFSYGELLDLIILFTLLTIHKMKMCGLQSLMRRLEGKEFMKIW